MRRKLFGMVGALAATLVLGIVFGGCLKVYHFYSVLPFAGNPYYYWVYRGNKR